MTKRSILVVEFELLWVVATGVKINYLGWEKR